MRVSDSLRGRHIVLTGVTGFLGKVFAALLLQEVEDVRCVTLVVRGKGRKVTARRRVEQMLERSPGFRTLREAHGSGFAEFVSSRLQVVEGDVERPRFGLGMDVLEGLRGGSVDALIHCAGLTDFSPDPARALRANVMGAKHAADLARFLGAPLMHISTCFVAGNVSGTIRECIQPGVAPSGETFSVTEEIHRLDRLCQEGEAAHDRTVRIDRGTARANALGWPNLYCYTKALAEHLLAARKDVDITIVRPAIVECAQTYPFAGWNEGLNTAGPLAWLISTAFRRLPTRTAHAFDVVPVDEVARGMILVLCAMLRGDRPGVVQLASSDVNAFTFDRAVELTGLGFRRWVRKGGGTPHDRVLRLLDPVPVSLNEEGESVVPGLRRVLSRVSGHIQDESWKGRLVDWDGQLERIEHMLELYRPFLYDNRYIFQTDTVRALSAELEGDEGTFAWSVPEINWRTYWVDVEYPGLATWCFPIIRGEDVPMDAPMSPRLQLSSGTHSASMAGK